MWIFLTNSCLSEMGPRSLDMQCLCSSQTYQNAGIADAGVTIVSNVQQLEATAKCVTCWCVQCSEMTQDCTLVDDALQCALVTCLGRL